jgi:hypothetical protein
MHGWAYPSEAPLLSVTLQLLRAGDNLAKFGRLIGLWASTLCAWYPHAILGKSHVSNSSVQPDCSCSESLQEHVYSSRIHFPHERWVRGYLHTWKQDVTGCHLEVIH